MNIRTFIALIFFLVPVQANATDRFFDDIESFSPSKRYLVTANSPDNQKEKGGDPFQSNFTYQCKDTKINQVLWTRKQPMGEPDKIEDSEHVFPEEGSPVSIHISDSGNTVLYTDWDELVFLDSKGNEKGKLHILRDCLTKEENEKYVDETTAGPMWAGMSHWYFVNSVAGEFFVIRPWWGRHLVFALDNGKAVTPTDKLNGILAKAEKEYVISVLNSVLDGTMKECDCCDGPHDAAFAAWLAGIQKIQDAVPALRMLENNSSIGSSTSGGFDEVSEGRIDPFDYSTYNTRQLVHLSLRRLGEKPGAFPCTSFKKEHEDYDKMEEYIRQAVPGTRELNANKLEEGLSPEQVIDLIDCPDYIDGRNWQYDIDDKLPYTLTISWTDERTVKSIYKVSPALWQEGTARDRP